MKRVKIMRGLPGGGKSFYAKKNFPTAKFFSTDDYFMVNGVYTFDVLKLVEYHNLNLLAFLRALQEGVEFLVVDNTNIKVFEIAPYYRLAEAFGYDVEIVYVVADPEKCKAMNTHGVPGNLIDTMANSFEPIPHWWRQRIVINN